jgi:hypothetical protein
MPAAKLLTKGEFPILMKMLRIMPDTQASLNWSYFGYAQRGQLYGKGADTVYVVHACSDSIRFMRAGQIYTQDYDGFSGTVLELSIQQAAVNALGMAYFAQMEVEFALGFCMPFMELGVVGDVALMSGDVASFLLQNGSTFSDLNAMITAIWTCHHDVKPYSPTLADKVLYGSLKGFTKALPGAFWDSLLSPSASDVGALAGGLMSGIGGAGLRLGLLSLKSMCMLFRDLAKEIVKAVFGVVKGKAAYSTTDVGGAAHTLGPSAAVFGGLSSAALTGGKLSATTLAKLVKDIKAGMDTLRLKGGTLIITVDDADIVQIVKDIMAYPNEIAKCFDDLDKAMAGL